MTCGELIEQIDRFFSANSVAVVGASSTPGKIGHEILRSLKESGYGGAIYPVNPRGGEILGLSCYTSLLDIPGKVDLAVLVTSSSSTPQVMRDCVKKGIKNVIIVSGGFKELGGEAKKLEDEVSWIASKNGIRVIGPNCIGVFNPKTRLDTFFQSRQRMLRPGKGSIAFLTQSGTFGTVMLEWIAETPGLGISKFVSYGNRCDVDEADLITYLAEDRDTKVILVYIEGLADGRKFLNVAKEVTPKKPIVVLKAGRTEQGSRAAVSHTGWLAGSYQIYVAAFNQSGIVEASNFEELFDMAKALALQPFSPGNRVAMLSNGAGPMVMAVDYLPEKGLVLARLSEEVEREMGDLFPPFYVVSNPVDLTGSATSRDYEVALQRLVKDPNVDTITPFFVFQDTPLDEGIIEVMSRVSKIAEASRKPLLCCAAGGPYSKKMAKELERMGIPVYPTPERLITGAYALYRYGQVKHHER